MEDALKEENLNSLKMRNMPVGKLLWNMSLPAIFSMLVQALYNIVDTIFVSFKVGEAGVQALSIVNPMQFLIMAVGIGLSVGTNVQIAKKLGEGKPEEASNVAKTGLMMSVSAYFLFIIIGLTVSRPFVAAFAEGDADVEAMGSIYLMIVSVASLGVFVELSCSKILQGTGNMKIPMISQLIGAGTNIILDPILIFAADMGVTGAAVATIIGQFASATFVFLMLLKGKHDVSLKLKGFKIKKENIMAILIVGLPTMVMNATNGFTVIILNTILTTLGLGAAIKVLGTYLKLNSFVFMPVFGLTQGLMPILSYNYGYGDKKRYVKALRLALTAAFGIMIVGMILFLAMPGVLMRMFNPGEEFMTTGKYALRIISISFPAAAFGIVMTTAMQSFHKGLTSLIMSLLRQVVLLIPMAILLGYFTGLKGFWFSYPIAEYFVLAAFLPYMIYTVKTRFAALESKKEEPVLVELEKPADPFAGEADAVPVPSPEGVEDSVRYSSADEPGPETGDEKQGENTL